MDALHMIPGGQEADTLYSLLIVDDEEIIRKGLQQYMPWEEMNFCIAGEAETGVQALEAVRRLHPDVVLCDIRMPQMDGLTFIRHLREERHACKVVMLTGYTDFELMRSAIVLNVSDYVQKPVDVEELRNVFERLRRTLDAEKDAAPAGEEAKAGRYTSLIDDIHAYIDENYATVHLRDLEALTHYSQNYLCKIFQQETGMQFNDYLRDVRLNKAAKILLEDYRVKVYEVSELVGYRNNKSFSKAFYQKYGMTPSDYRKKQRP